MPSEVLHRTIYQWLIITIGLFALFFDMCDMKFAFSRSLKMKLDTCSAIRKLECDLSLAINSSKCSETAYGMLYTAGNDEIQNLKYITLVKGVSKTVLIYWHPAFL